MEGTVVSRQGMSMRTVLLLSIGAITALTYVLSSLPSLYSVA
jgi:hypothetical protein